MEPKLCPFEKIHPSELKRDADYFMTHAYNEAIEAWKKDEVPIGAVIERDGRIIAAAPINRAPLMIRLPTQKFLPLAKRHMPLATGD